MSKRYRFIDFAAPHPRNINYMFTCALCDWPLAEGNLNDHLMARHQVNPNRIKVRVIHRADKIYYPLEGKIR